MTRGILSYLNPFTKLTFLIVICITTGFIVTFVGAFIGTILFKIGLSELFSIENISVRENIDPLKYLQAVQSISLFIIPPFLFNYFCFDTTNSLTIEIKKTPKLPSFILIIFAILSVMPIINLLSTINNSLHLPHSLSGIENWMKMQELQLGELTLIFLKADSIQVMLLNVFIMAFLPAIGEELLFRGIIQKLFSSIVNNKHLGILITAIIFSAIHMQFYGFLPRMVLGILLGYLVLWSGSIWSSIWAHFLNNGIGVVSVYLQGKGLIGSGIDHVGTSSDTLNLLLSSSLIFILSVFLIYNEEQKINGLTSFRNFGRGE